MKVKIISATSYQTYPITDDMIEIEEDVLAEIGRTKCFENGKIVDYTITKTNEQLIAELKKQLSDTDYQVLKWKEGELTDEEFEPMRLQRKAWREEIRSLGG